LTVVELVARISGSSSTSAPRRAVLISTNTRAHRFVTKCLPKNRSARGMPRTLWVQGLQERLSRANPILRHTHSLSAGQRQIRDEVRGMVSRKIPDAPAFRCVGCGGTRLLPLTFAGSRRTRRSELPVRPNAKCITCGSRYIGTHVLPAESTLIWLAACTDANQSAPWGLALAEWGLLLDGGSRGVSFQTQTPGARTQAIRSRLPVVLLT
jgi:hypothetical protein